MAAGADATSGSAGSVHRGSGRARTERARKGPAKCRVCDRGLVTAEERTLGRCRSCPSRLNDDLLGALREWRLERSRERGVPAYVIFTDMTLQAIAEQVPASVETLASIPGVGPMKIDMYGDEVLALVRAHA